jgi:putative SOS response-associated peptidase YedK
VPIITKDGPAPSFWGFKGYGGNRLLINARAESAAVKPTFRDSFLTGRCVVPTNGFFEWTKSKRKIKYLFEMPDEHLLYLAGLYGTFENELCMVVLTHGANDSVGDVHDRMPVILKDDQLTLWLNETEEARRMLEMQSPRLVKRISSASEATVPVQLSFMDSEES